MNQHRFRQNDVAAELEIHPKNSQSVAKVGWQTKSAAEPKRQQNGTVQTDDRPLTSIWREVEGSPNSLIYIFSSCIYLIPTLST